MCPNLILYDYRASLNWQYYFEFKKSGWKLNRDTKRITFTDGKNIGELKLIGKMARSVKLTKSQEDTNQSTFPN
jgi:hypothetical protein